MKRITMNHVKVRIRKGKKDGGYFSFLGEQETVTLIRRTDTTRWTGKRVTGKYIFLSCDSLDTKRKKGGETERDNLSTLFRITMKIKNRGRRLTNGLVD